MQCNVEILALTICWTIFFLCQCATARSDDRWDIISKCFHSLHANSVLWSYLIWCFFASVEVATYAGNIIYFRPAVLVYSLAYSYTFSVIIVFYLVVFSAKMLLLQLPVWPQRCWCFKCHISAELKWESRIVESLNLVFFFFSSQLYTVCCVCDYVLCVCVCVFVCVCVCVCVRALPCHPTV